MHPKLSELADRYDRTKGLLSDIESETGYLSLTTRTVNDLRHTLDHILKGVALERNGELEQADYLYSGAIEHLREHTLNSFENVAGMVLKATWKRLEEAGFFTDSAQAFDLYRRATRSYSLGRQTRTEDEDASLAHFRQAARLALEARKMIKPEPRWRRFVVWWALALGLATLANVAFGVYQALSK